jgi:hypothetical protein
MPICFTPRELNEASLDANARLVGATPMWDWAGDGATAFTHCPTGDRSPRPAGSAAAREVRPRAAHKVMRILVPAW